jgi:hypothetical protein
LKINGKNSINLDSAEGSTRTLEIVSFNLTIGSFTYTVTAHVIRGFKYHLLLSTDTGKLFPIVIDLQNRKAILKNKAPEFKPKPQQQLSLNKSQHKLKVLRKPLTSSKNTKTALSLTVILALFTTLFATT